MSTPCVLIENGRCYYASNGDASRADVRRNPETAQEYVASWSGMARDHLDAFVQEKDRNLFLKIGTRGAAVPLALYSAVADTALSVVGGIAPSLHAMVTGKVSVKQVIVGIGDKLVETAISIPTAYKEIVVGDHPANAAYKAYCGILDSGMIVSGGAGVIRGGMTLAGKTLAPIRRVAEGAADAVANTTMGGGMGMVLAEGAVLVDGSAATATVAAAGGWPSGLWSLAAMSEAKGATGEGGGGSTGASVVDRLREKLTQSGTTQQQFATAIGLEQSSVSKWFERGRIPKQYWGVVNKFILDGVLPVGVNLSLPTPFLKNLIGNILPNMTSSIEHVAPTSAPNIFTIATTDGKAYEVVVTGIVRELK